MTTGQRKVILVTFAGRRDRMELLARYVHAAIARGVINEWHVWDFSRDQNDTRWLRERFPITQGTPSDSTEYFRLPEPISFGQNAKELRFSVRATNDVHIGLKNLSQGGSSYEIVLGGWSNQASAIRRFDDPASLSDVALRDSSQKPIVFCSTPDLLPEFGFSEVRIEVTSGQLTVFLGEKLALHVPGVEEPSVFEVLYRTGYGCNGDWQFAEFESSPARLFVSGPVPYYRAGQPYNRAYQHYVANFDRYGNDMFLKCDDDIVYFDLRRISDLIAFRERHPEFFLVSANVLNNGVCAFYQQQVGAIPTNLVQLELPPGGLHGTLWSSGAKAETLHRLFLHELTSFRACHPRPIIWNDRLSINFVAFLGRDLVHIPDIMHDDEHDLCYGVRKRTRKQNCIYPSFVASHLSFGPQDSEMNIPDILDRYEALAMRELAP